MTDKDRIKGAGRELYGRGEEAFGAATDDLEMRARGGLDQMAGKAQSAVGRAGEALRETAEDAIEAGRDYFGQGRRSLGRQRMGRYSRSGESGGQETGAIAASPLGFLLITAVAGFALASLLRRRD